MLDILIIGILKYIFLDLKIIATFIPHSFQFIIKNIYLGQV